ncbi:MAG: DNA cytosine methyltransferase [Clostridiales bacterium]|jgi:DNA (cytosine-5)-methyltransferase 1|nr:DNA cytosine methyltransferase [Clostridiales bacterium]
MLVNQNYKESGKNRDVISLFSGAMGMDIGLSKSGLNVRIGQDVDRTCVDTVEANNCKAILGDIQEIQPERLLEAAGLSAAEPFLVCGGPPCQPFSTAGMRLGLNDPRGSLFKDFVRMLLAIRPRFFIMENVKGLMSAQVLDGGKPVESALEVVLDEVTSLGYRTVYGVLDAVNYGAPQFRERFVLVGSRDHEGIFLPVPTRFQTHQDPSYRWRTLRSAIGDLEGDHGECAHFAAERLAYLKMVPEGGNWRSLPPDLVEKAMGGAFRSGGGKVGFYRRLSYDQPAPTLVTSPVQKASMLCHPVLDRPLSVKEYARIQQFPDEWSFAGSMASKYKQIGNAVPIGLAEALGQVLISVADGSSTIETKRTRGTDVHSKLKNALEMWVNFGNQ